MDVLESHLEVFCISDFWNYFYPVSDDTGSLPIMVKSAHRCVVADIEKYLVASLCETLGLVLR